MSRIPNPAAIVGAVAGLAIVGFGLYAWRKGGIAPAAGELARQVPNVIGSAAGGLVIGAGEVIGIPPTSRTRCEEAIAARDLWRASFDCDAPTFARESWRIFREPAVDESILDPRDAQARRPIDTQDEMRRRGTGAGTVPPEPAPAWDLPAIDSQTWYGVP